MKKDDHGNLSVRPATLADVDSLMEVFDAARAIMRATGNLTQWPVGYPARSTVEDDIAAHRCHVVVDSNGEIAGCFSFIPGPDPTYSVIDGEWPDNRPYYVIHRLASSGKVRGIARTCLDFCRSRCDVIRIDTHADNRPMLNWLRKEGFTHCGVIRIADGSPREAFLLECSQHPSSAE